MAITGTDRGTGGNNGSESATVISPASTLAAGSTGVLAFAADNANGSTTNFPASITDSVGNVWYRVRELLGGAVANATEETAVYASQLTTQLTSSNNITLTYTAANVVAKAWTLTELAPASGNRVIWKSNTNATASTAVTTISVNLSNVGNGDVAFGCCGVESGDTFVGDSDSTNGSWSTKQSTGFGVANAGMSVISQYKVATAAGTQTYNPTWTTADGQNVTCVFTETDAKARAVSGDGTSSASNAVAISLPLIAGSMGVLLMAADNAGASGSATNLPASIVDSAGNTWTQRQDAIFDPAAASAGVELGIWTSLLTANLAVTDTITITYTGVNVPVKCWGLWEFSDARAYANSGAGTGAATGTPSVTTGSITTPNYVIGICGAETEDTFASDSDTSSGAWSAPIKAFAGTTGGNAMSIITQYKRVSAGGTQTYNPTLTSADTMIAWAELTVRRIFITGG